MKKKLPSTSSAQRASPRAATGSKPRAAASSTPAAAPRRVAVIGAGMAGVACARTLQQAGWAVTLLEQFDQVGGRMTSQDSPFGVFDTGAQYFTVRDARFERALREATAPGLVQRWPANAVSLVAKASASTPATARMQPPMELEADALAAQSDPRSADWWVAAPRMDALIAHWAQPLQSDHADGDAAHAQTGLMLGAQVVEIERDSLHPRQWQLRVARADKSLRVLPGFDAVLLTTPPEVAQELLAPIARHLPASASLTDRLAPVQVAPCWTLMLAFPQANQPGLSQFGPAWDAAHSQHHRLTWLSRECAKPGREPIERWTVQASAEWTHKHRADSPDRVQAKLTKAFSELTGIRVQPSHSQLVGWSWARTTQPLGRSHLWQARSGLGVAGDWCIGHRVEDAFVSGLSLALAVLGAASA